MYALKQAAILAYETHKRRLTPHGYAHIVGIFIIHYDQYPIGKVRSSYVVSFNRELIIFFEIPFVC